VPERVHHPSQDLMTALLRAAHDEPSDPAHVACSQLNGLASW
jgi:hypothetical protein